MYDYLYPSFNPFSELPADTPTLLSPPVGIYSQAIFKDMPAGVTPFPPDL